MSDIADSINVRLGERDKENLRFILADQAHMNISEVVRWLMEDYRRKHDQRESKDHKLDDIREAVGLLDRKLVMLMRAQGLLPFPDCTEFEEVEFQK